MKNKQNMIKITGLLIIAAIALAWLSASTNADNKRFYELRQNISVPPKQSDTITMVNSYERLMHRYIALSENNMAEMDKNSDVVISKLDSIERKIDDLGTRLERIEKALNITDELPQPQAPEIPEPEMPKVPEPEIPEV